MQLALNQPSQKNQSDHIVAEFLQFLVGRWNSPLPAQRVSKIRLLILLASPPSNGETGDETVHQIDDMFGWGKARFK